MCQEGKSIVHALARIAHFRYNMHKCIFILCRPTFAIFSRYNIHLCMAVACVCVWERERTLPSYTTMLLCTIQHQNSRTDRYINLFIGEWDLQPMALSLSPSFYSFLPIVFSSTFIFFIFFRSLLFCYSLFIRSSCIFQFAQRAHRRRSNRLDTFAIVCSCSMCGVPRLCARILYCRGAKKSVWFVAKDNAKSRSNRVATGKEQTKNHFASIVCTARRQCSSHSRYDSLTQWAVFHRVLALLPEITSHGISHG